MQYKGYLIDLDGTMYRGSEEINGAKEFIRLLQNKGIPYLFITNNSTLTRPKVVEKLSQFDIETTNSHVLTSAIATANYVARNKANARCFIIGEQGLHDAFQEVGISHAMKQIDYVIVGLDRDVTYEKIAQASLAIRHGATFISTNKDAAIPTERGLLPGNGAITAAISVSSGVDPIFIGKPETIIMEEALQVIGLSREEVLLVGDNYETDILAGIDSGIDTLMVLTGFSAKKDITGLDKQPTYVMKNLIEWMHVKKA